MSKKSWWRADRPYLKALAVALGPLGAPVEAYLQKENDEQLGRMESLLHELVDMERANAVRVGQLISNAMGSSSAPDEVVAAARAAMEAIVVPNDGAGLLVRQPVGPMEAPTRISIPYLRKLVMEGVTGAYQRMADLRTDVAATSFDLARFPDVPTVAEGALLFADELRHQAVVVQEEVLRQLARRNPWVAELRQALAVVLAFGADRAGDGNV